MLPGPPCTTTTAGCSPPVSPVTRYQVRYPPKDAQPFVIGGTAMLITSSVSLVPGTRGRTHVHV